MAKAHATLGARHWRTTVTANGHEIIADEPPALGGEGAGPAPYDLLLASLGACTAITLGMYAERKGWVLERLDIDLHFRGGDAPEIERVLTIAGPDEAQCARLADIAERTPVTLTLKSGVPIATRLA